MKRPSKIRGLAALIVGASLASGIVVGVTASPAQAEPDWPPYELFMTRADCVAEGNAGVAEGEFSYYMCYYSARMALWELFVDY